MAVDDTVLYTITDEEVSRSSIVQDMINFYWQLFQVGDTKVTDFNEGSEIRNLLEVQAVDTFNLRDEQNELSKIAFIETAYGEWLDKHGAMPNIALPREEGLPSEGYVTFSLPEATDTQISIPEGTILTSEENDMDYSTDSEVLIGAGESSAYVHCTCLLDGDEGNCSANTLNIISDEYINIQGLTVNNTEAFTGGVNYEEDDEYRERLLSYEQRDDFGSLPYYNNLAENVYGVHDVLFINATGYTKKILVNGDTKPTPDTVLADVLEQFTLAENIILGHSFTVDKPSYLECKLKVSYTSDDEINEEDITDMLQALFDGGVPVAGYEMEGLDIGETLTTYMMDSTMDLFDDITSYTVQIKLYDGSSWDSEWSDFADVTPDPDEVLQLDDVTVERIT